VSPIEPAKLPQKIRDSELQEEERSKANKISEAKIYWIQITISFIFGIATYYFLEYKRTPDILNLPLGGFFSGFGLIFGIYMLSLLVVPILIYHFQSKESFFASFRKALNSFGTQIALYFLLCGCVFMINI